MLLMRLAPRFIGALISLATFNAHASLTCEHLFDPHPHLSAKQVEALRGLEGGEYKSSVQRISIAGVERLVVVVRERHVKSAEDAARFQKILSSFEFHGLEGLDISNYWFPSVMTKILNHKKTAKLSKGSSLHEVENAHARGEFQTMFADLLSTEIRDGHSSKAMAFEVIDNGAFFKMMAERLASSPIERSAIKPAQDLVLGLDGEELKAMIEAKLTGVTLPVTASTAPKVTAFSLESDYKPGIRENLKVLSFAAAPIVRSTLACYAAACAVGATAYALTHDVRFIETGVIGYLAPFTGSALLHAFGRDFFALDRRNTHMMKTLTNVLEKEPEIDTIVVTVGQLHVSGIVGLLQAQGSQTVELP